MFVILDEREKAHWKRDNETTDINGMTSHGRMIMNIAEYVVVLKGETYEVIKDRMTGELGEYPIEELPKIVKDKLVHRLKVRDQVHTDEE